MNIFRIVTRHGINIDITPLPLDFNFVHVCTQIKADGAYKSETLWVDYDSISFMLYGDPTATPGFMATPHPAPTSVQ